MVEPLFTNRIQWLPGRLDQAHNNYNKLLPMIGILADDCIRGAVERRRKTILG